MLKNEQIICFSNNEWQAVPTSKEHVMKILASQNRVLYLENIGQRRPFFKLEDFKKIIRRLRNWSKGSQKVDKNLTILSPLVLPFYGSRLIRKFNQIILKKQIIRQLPGDNQQPILWITLPTAVDLVGKLNEKLSIYHCVDDFSAFETLSAPLISLLEKELCEKADLLFVSNKALFEIKKKKYPGKTFFVPHGANVDLFLETLRKKTSEPKELRALPRPRIAFAGKIGYSTNLGLINDLAQNNPQLSFILIGPITFDAKKEELKKLKKQANVFFSGQVPYEKLPLYLKYSDIFLLPYRLTKQIKYSQPQIMYEYLSLGKPIVSIDIPAVEQFNDLIYIAKNFADFEQKLKEAGAEKNEKLSQQRIKVAQENSWPKRIEEISKIIQNAKIKSQNEN